MAQGESWQTEMAAQQARDDAMRAASKTVDDAAKAATAAMASKIERLAATKTVDPGDRSPR